MCARESGSHIDTKLRSPIPKKRSPSAWLYACPYFFLFEPFPLSSPLFLPLFSLYYSLSWSHQSSICQRTIHRFEVESLSVWIVSFYLTLSLLAALSFFFNCLSPKPKRPCALVLAYLSYVFPLGPFFPPLLPSPDIWILHLAACWREREKRESK